MSPLMVAIAILVKKDSKGPVLFKQKRMGKNQEIFTLYKFRSMVHNAEELKSNYLHLDYTDGPVFKAKNDPRYTKLGKFLSDKNLDEIPQLFNILKGDMGFVGFRPPTIDEVEKYSDWHKERFKGRPGLTSSWAIEGMHNIKFDDWIKKDIEYHKNESIGKDLEIVWKTGMRFLKGIKRN